jgi:hypothetical protein
MTIQEFNIQARAYDILEAKKNSENPEKFFDEAVDNSLQYGASVICVEINEQSNSAKVTDNGDGFTNLAAFKAFHQPYHQPVQLGISRYGIGGKIFKTLSDKRIVYSISQSEDARNQKNVYFSFWDTSTPESTDAPEVFCFSLSDEVPQRATEILEQYNLLTEFKFALEANDTGTHVCLVEINSERVKNFFRNWSKMYSKVKDSFFERYHLLINQQKTEIAVDYINNKGESKNPVVIAGFDPRSNLDKRLTSGSRPFVKRIGPTEIYSWIKNESSKRLKTRGIHVYRDDIKIKTISFVKLHGKNAHDFVDIDINKTGWRMNVESQMIMMRSNSDDSFNLGETKDKIRLPAAIGVAAAEEMTRLRSIVDRDRKTRLASKPRSKNNTVEISVPNTQIELENPQSYIKTTKGVEIVHGSILYEKLVAEDISATDLVFHIFQCFDDLYQEKNSKDRAAFTSNVNRMGQMLEKMLNTKI